MTEHLSPSHPELPRVEHTIEVDSDKPFLSLDTATFKALGTVDYEAIDSMAADVGIEVDSGIIAIDVDGERRYINTSREDFGTSVRNVTEVEPSDVDVDKTETVIISSEQFMQGLDQMTEEYLEQSVTSESGLVSAADELATSARRIRGQFEEVEQQMSIIMRTVYDGQSDPGQLSRRLSAVQDTITTARASLQNQASLSDDAGRFTRQMQTSVEDAANGLQSRVSQYSAEVTTQVQEAEKSGADVDDEQVRLALDKATHTGFLLRQMEASVETAFTGTRRLQDNIDETNQGINRIVMMTDELISQVRYGRASTDDIENVYRFVRITASGYDEQTRPSIARLSAAIDELASSRRSMSAAR